MNFTHFASTRLSKSSRQGSRKKKDLVEKREVNFSYFRSPGLSRSLSTHGSGKGRHLVDEDRSEFQLLSIDGIVRIISTVGLEITEI